MNDRYGRDDRSDPRGRQGSRESNWQDRETRDYDHPRQQQQWHDENRTYGESIQRNRGGGQMGGQQGSYGGGSQDFWDRDDGDGWSSTESHGRSDYGSQRGGWQGGGMSGSARRSESQGGYGSQDYGSQGMRGGERKQGGRYDNDRQSSQRSMGGYGQSGYGSRDSDFSSFTGNDFGGRDFSGGHSAYGSSYTGASGQGFGSRGGQAGGGDYGRRSGYRGGVGGREYMGSDDGRDDRGFIERAGDAIAGWFSDDDGTSRGGQMNHRGRGPSGYTRSDERIKEDANDHLTHDPSVDASNITVSVESGEVTLSGTVNSRFAKRRAEDCVDHVSGVKHVQNNLRVQDRMAGNQSGMGQSSSGQSGMTAGSTGTSSTGANSTGAGTTANQPSATAGTSTGSSATKSGSGSTAR